jgi:hypothetical protein
MKTKIPRSIQCNNMSSFIAIVLVDVNIIAIYELWKSSEFVYYQIMQLSEQKYRLAIHFAIHFAEHNFGPFGHNFFVIVLFQSLSKTLIRVSFTSLYLQICTFITVSHLYQATNVGLIFVVHSFISINTFIIFSLVYAITRCIGMNYENNNSLYKYSNSNF